MSLPPGDQVHPSRPSDNDGSSLAPSDQAPRSQPTHRNSSPGSATEELRDKRFPSRRLQLKLTDADAATRIKQLETECRHIGRPDLLQNYRPDDLRNLVEVVAPQKLAQQCLKAEIEMARIRATYPTLVENDLADLFNSCSFVHRGFDKHGAPILWINPSLIPRRLSNNVELRVAHQIFLVLHTAAMRSHCSIVLISQEKGGKPLEHSYNVMYPFLKAVRAIFLPIAKADKVYLHQAGWSARTTASVFLKLMPGMKEIFQTIEPKDLLKIVANDKDIPDWMGVPGVGTPISANEQTVGCWREEILNGYHPTLGHWLNRDEPIFNEVENSNTPSNEDTLFESDRDVCSQSSDVCNSGKQDFESSSSSGTCTMENCEDELF